MRVELQNKISTGVFSKALVDIGYGRILVEASTGLISFPPNFCQFPNSKMFANISENYKNHAWLSKRAILAGWLSDNYVTQSESTQTVQRNKTDERIMKNLIEATIIIGKFKGEDFLIPRIPLLQYALHSQIQLINPKVNC